MSDTYGEYDDASDTYSNNAIDPKFHQYRNFYRDHNVNFFGIKYNDSDFFSIKYDKQHECDSDYESDSESDSESNDYLYE